MNQISAVFTSVRLIAHNLIEYLLGCRQRRDGRSTGTVAVSIISVCRGAGDGWASRQAVIERAALAIGPTFGY